METEGSRSAVTVPPTAGVAMNEVRRRSGSACTDAPTTHAPVAQGHTGRGAEGQAVQQLGGQCRTPGGMGSDWEL